VGAVRRADRCHVPGMKSPPCDGGSPSAPGRRHSLPEPGRHLTYRQVRPEPTNRKEVTRSKIANAEESAGQSTYSAADACVRPSVPQYGQRISLTCENRESAARRGAVRRISASLRPVRRDTVLHICSTHAG
jgi:hypothetical protein